jgi:asparagine synthase (glutamine-hydrolysing)
MCGICGYIGGDASEAAETIVRRMMAAIAHRGPDEEGMLLAPPLAAGIRRLSIIDLPGGSQPLWNEDHTIGVVYNGEIYNFRELRSELESAGHRFRTHSDTEVIVHAYETWGERSVERLQGMFAFAIVETPKALQGRAARVFLARDRLGIKPLYYAVANGKLLFASELRTILASGVVQPKISHEAVTAYLLFGSVCEPGTLIEGIRSLPPGHSLMISADAPAADSAPKPYWWPRLATQANQNHSGEVQDSKEQPAAQVRSILEKSVERHLIADVPIGIFLSSGLDSTALAALACARQEGIHTFTVAFPDEGFSEAELARQLAQRLKSIHSELAISDSDMLARLDEAIDAFDQPSMDGINTFFVSWAARQAGLKVALSGLGSDELFGGYRSFRQTAPLAKLARAARYVPRTVRKWSVGIAEKSRAFPGTRTQLRKGAASWLDPEALPHPYFFARTLFPPQAVAATLQQGFESWRSASWWQPLIGATREAAAADEFTRVSWLELRSYLANTLLRDTDTMSMRHSLEVRVPFLDTGLVEFVLALPASAKSSANRPKGLLIQALGGLLPPEIVAQRKRTFTFPWENWLRGKLGKKVSDSLGEWSPELSEVLDAKFAHEVWEDFQRGDTTWSRPWSLYVLNEWVKRNCRPAAAGNSRPQNTAAVSAA